MSHFWKAALAAVCVSGSVPAFAEEGVKEPARFIVLEADIHIPSTQRVHGYEVVDEDTILIKSGATRLYMAELSGRCGRSARFGTSIGIDSNGGGRIDRHSEVIVDGRRCAIDSISLVERALAEPEPEPEPQAAEQN